eukprot:13911018-Alexandrium_andersonii.AAC.1
MAFPEWHFIASADGSEAEWPEEDGPEYYCIGSDSDADDCGDLSGERDPCAGPLFRSQVSLGQSSERCVERGPGGHGTPE